MISYDIDNTSIELKLMQELKELGEPCQFMKNGWFLKSCKQQDDISNELQNVCGGANGVVLITRIKEIKDMAGWLGANAYDWLKNINWAIKDRN